MATSALGQARAFWAQSKAWKKMEFLQQFQQSKEMMLSEPKKSRTQPNKQQSHIFWKSLKHRKRFALQLLWHQWKSCCSIICANIVLNICPFCKGPAPLRPRSAAARAHLSPQAAARHISTTLTSNGNAYRNEKIENTIYSYIYIYIRILNVLNSFRYIYNML